MILTAPIPTYKVLEILGLSYFLKLKKMIFSVNFTVIRIAEEKVLDRNIEPRQVH